MKHLMSGSIRNGEYCVLETLNVPPGFALGNIEGLRVLGKQNSLFLLGSVIKCLPVKMYSLMLL